jgi:hypothetical protein
MKPRHSWALTLLPISVALAVWAPAPLSATEFRVQSDTLIRSMQRDIGGVKDKSVTPGYEYLQVDAGQLTEKGFSLHSYGWGRFDFADSLYFDNRDDGELLYGYLQYADPATALDLKVGRQNIAVGVGNDVIDGLQVSGDLGAGLVASAYGGQPVGFTSVNGRTGDSIYGGRLGYRQRQYGEVGVSGKISDNDSVTAEETVGLDLSLFLPGEISIYGMSSRNLESKGWAEHSYELRIPFKTVSFRPYFGQYDYEHYFGTGVNTVNPFRVLAINGEKLRVIGLDTTVRYSGSLDLGVKIKGNDYDRTNGSSYASGLVVWHGDKLSQTGVEVGYMNGDLDKQKYLLTRLFGYWEAPSGFGIGFFSGDLMWARYKESLYGRDNSLFLSLGTGRNFLDNALEVKLSGDYSRDPYFDSDVRGLLAVTYRYSKK